MYRQCRVNINIWHQYVCYASEYTNSGLFMEMKYFSITSSNNLLCLELNRKLKKANKNKLPNSYINQGAQVHVKTSVFNF